MFAIVGIKYNLFINVGICLSSTITQESVIISAMCLHKNAINLDNILVCSERFEHARYITMYVVLAKHLFQILN